MGRKRKNYKFRIGADERSYTLEKQVKSKSTSSSYSWTAIRWFPSAKALADYLRGMEAKYLVSTGCGIIEALEAGNKMIEDLLKAETKEFDIRDWESNNDKS
jgi:hypothetical protein